MFTGQKFYFYNHIDESLISYVLKQNGQVEQKYSEEILIVLTVDSPGDFVSTGREIQAFIKENKITEAQFEKLTFVSQYWIEESQKRKEKLPVEGFNLGELFKIISQGDKSVYWTPKKS